MQPHRLPYEQYEAIEAVNWSTLKEMGKSPLHYKHRRFVRRKDKDYLALGRAVHTAVFEPDRFVLDYAVFKGERRAGKVWEAFKEAHQHETILRESDYVSCCEIRDAVRAHPLVAPYLKAGRAEHSITWTDPATGLSCKARLDWVSDSKPAIGDLKTAQTIDAERFGGAAARYGYHCQLAFYAEGYKQVTGEELRAVIIAVESGAPYDVGVFQVDADALYAGAEKCRELLRKLKDCEARRAWPGRYQEEKPLYLPSWAFMGGEDEQAEAYAA